MNIIKLILGVIIVFMLMSSLFWVGLTASYVIVSLALWDFTFDVDLFLFSVRLSLICGLVAVLFMLTKDWHGFKDALGIR